MEVFKDLNGVFSWRKGLTALVGFVFGFSCIGYLFGLRPLPKSYLIIISGVFAFYFTKQLFQKNGTISKKK